MADRSRGRCVRDRIRQDWFHRRAAGLSRATGLRSQEYRRDANFFGPHHRRALSVHRGEKRLGRLSNAGCGRQDAQQRVHAYGRVPSYRWRWTLGAAGAAGTGERIARTIPPRLRKALIANLEPVLADRSSTQRRMSLTKCHIRYNLNSSWTPRRLNGPWKAAGCGALRSATP